MKLNLNLPINSVSFGQISNLLIRTIYDRELAGDTTVDYSLFPIGQTDLSSQKEDQEFAKWIHGKMAKAFEHYDRSIPVFKLWHLDQSLQSYGKEQTLLSFYELDRPTKIELNIAKNNKLAFTSQYTCDVFNTFGVKCDYIPLAFDHLNFKTITKKYHKDDRIVFNLCGKFEKRKHHGKIIQSWIKKFGGNSKYVLQCAVYNGFFNEQQNSQLIGQTVGPNKPFNVVFFPNMKENSIYNEFLNSSNIIIGMSGGEGWGLPEFHSVAMGKHSVILNAHGYKSWANDANSTLVTPSGKIDSADGAFFRQGEAFNQGSIFDWDEEAFIAGCEKAIEKVKSSPINSEGLKIQQEFTATSFLDNILKLVNK